MRVTLTEATDLQPVVGSKPGRQLIQIINPGWGSSGYYSEAALKQAAKDKIWPAGTHMYIDHPSASENYERPERTLRDLAAVLVEDARWDNKRKALVAEARVYPHWSQPLADMADDIGVSIRAAAETENGEADGRKGRLVTKFLEGISVDYVTHAGRGGKVLQVLESARATEALASDRSDQLAELVKDAYGADKTWTWVIDFDDDAHLVTFGVETPDELDLFQQSYDVTDDVATALAGDRVEVRRKTTYVPVTDSDDTAEPVAEKPTAEAISFPGFGTATPPVEESTDAPEQDDEPAEPAEESAPTDAPVDPAGRSTTTQESEEDTMPQIEEARLRQLEADAGRVTALESERDQARRDAEEAKQRALQAEAATYARDFARNLVTKANGELAEASVARIVGDATRQALPLDESGRLDTTAFTPVVEKAREAEETYLAQVAEASGLGRVAGVGPSASATTVTEADFDRAVARAFGRKEA